MFAYSFVQRSDHTKPIKGTATSLTRHTGMHTVAAEYGFYHSRPRY